MCFYGKRMSCRCRCCGLPREEKVVWSSSCAELSEPLLEDIGSDICYGCMSVLDRSKSVCKEQWND